MKLHHFTVITTTLLSSLCLGMESSLVTLPLNKPSQEYQYAEGIRHGPRHFVYFQPLPTQIDEQLKEIVIELQAVQKLLSTQEFNTLLMPPKVALNVYDNDVSSEKPLPVVQKNRSQQAEKTMAILTNFLRDQQPINNSTENTPPIIKNLPFDKICIIDPAEIALLNILAIKQQEIEKLTLEKVKLQNDIKEKIKKDTKKRRQLAAKKRKKEKITAEKNAPVTNATYDIIGGTNSQAPLTKTQKVQALYQLFKLYKVKSELQLKKNLDQLAYNKDKSCLEGDLKFCSWHYCTRTNQLDFSITSHPSCPNNNSQSDDSSDDNQYQKLLEKYKTMRSDSESDESN